MSQNPFNIKGHHLVIREISQGSCLGNTTKGPHPRFSAAVYVNLRNKNMVILESKYRLADHAVCKAEVISYH